MHTELFCHKDVPERKNQLLKLNLGFTRDGALALELRKR
jgi:hypothetical protein